MPTMSDPLVSVGLPVYDGENYVAEAIESILGQTYGNLELIINDNASTDRTEAICLEYAAADDRVQYARSKHNLGGSRQLQRHGRSSTGPILRVDSA